MIKILNSNFKENKIEVLKMFQPGSWIYVENPNDREVNILSKKYFLDKSLILDALDPYEVPRLDTEETVSYIYTRFAGLDKNRVLSYPVLVILSADYIVTVSSQRLPFLDSLLKDGNIDTKDKAKFFIRIFNEINKTYEIYINDINKKVRKIIVEPGVIRNNDILRLVAHEEVLNTFLSDLFPTGSILKKILQGKDLMLHEDDKDLVEDIILSTEQLIELSKSNLKTIVNTREAYSAILTNNLNQTVKVLTALTVILTVPTIVSSVFGMNVGLPFEGHPFAFIFVILIIVGISVFVLYIFKRQDWF